MNGVSKIVSEQDIMMITFKDAPRSASLPQALNAFAQAGIVVDMICQSAPRTAKIDFSFTTQSKYFDNAMQVLAAHKSAETAPFISRGYSKINLFGEDMVISCGVAARALDALEAADIEVDLITTSDLDISMLVREENEDSALLLLKQAFSLEA